MTKRYTFLTGAMLALALAGPVRAEDATAATVVARVGTAEITLGHLIMARQSLPDQYQQLPDEVLFPGLLEQLVQQTLLAASVGDDSLRVKVSVDNERRGMRAAEALDSVMASAITEAAVAAAYDETFAKAAPGVEWNAAHILVKTKEEAEAIIAELGAGGEFATLAQKSSDGPSAANGGDLGWFGAGMMVAPFETAVAALEKGAVSAPVETQFGWHVIKLLDTRQTAVPPLAEVRGEIEQTLQRAALEARIAELSQGVQIERPGEALDPKLLSNFDLLGQ
jgi:peptidyl-prolyl cis-trans isomerase C